MSMRRIIHLIGTLLLVVGLLTSEAGQGPSVGAEGLRTHSKDGEPTMADDSVTEPLAPQLRLAVKPQSQIQGAEAGSDGLASDSVIVALATVPTIPTIPKATINVVGFLEYSFFGAKQEMLENQTKVSQFDESSHSSRACDP